MDPGRTAGLIIPGFIASDRTTFELRARWPRRAGGSTAGTLGWNLGAKADTVEHLRARLEAIGGGEPVLLVGWSLGGLFARELARGPGQGAGGGHAGLAVLGRPAPEQRLAAVRADRASSGRPAPIPRIFEAPVACLALWSRKDGIVAVRAARGLDHERDTHVELGCSHMAFAISRRATRQVVREIDNFLKIRPDRQPFLFR